MTELTIQRTTRQKHLLEWSQRVADCRSSVLSVSRWCTNHDIKPKTYYILHKKVFAAMIEQQKLQMMKTTDAEIKFVELSPPVPEATRDRALVASVHVGENM